MRRMFQKGEVKMGVCTDVQASAFFRAGWKEIDPIKESENGGKMETKYTKTDINRMSTAELKELTSANGISGTDEMTGAELKKILIEHYNL